MMFRKKADFVGFHDWIRDEMPIAAEYAYATG